MRLIVVNKDLLGENVKSYTDVIIEKYNMKKAPANYVKPTKEEVNEKYAALWKDFENIDSGSSRPTTIVHGSPDISSHRVMVDSNIIGKELNSVYKVELSNIDRTVGTLDRDDILKDTIKSMSESSGKGDFICTSDTCSMPQAHTTSEDTTVPDNTTVNTNDANESADETVESPDIDVSDIIDEMDESNKSNKSNELNDKKVNPSKVKNKLKNKPKKVKGGSTKPKPQSKTHTLKHTKKQLADLAEDLAVVSSRDMYKPQKQSINDVYKRYDKDFVTLTNRKRASYYIYELIVDCIKRKKNCIWFYHNDEEFVLNMLKSQYAKEGEFLFISVMSDIDNAKTIYKTESGDEIHVPVRGTLTDEKDMVGANQSSNEYMVGGNPTDTMEPATRLYQGEDNDAQNKVTSTGVILLLGVIFLPLIFLLYVFNFIRGVKKPKTKRKKDKDITEELPDEIAITE